jgi:hypothetical protein
VTDETDADDTDESESLTFAEMMDFGVDQIQKEVDNFEGDLPDHADKLLACRATDVLQAVTEIEVAQAVVEADDEAADQDVAERMAEDLAEDVVDVLLAVAAMKFEYDLDIEGAFENRVTLTESYEAFEEAIEDADTREQKAEAMEEHLEDAMVEEMGEMGVEAGTNVDAEDYDPDDDRDRHFQ